MMQVCDDWQRVDSPQPGEAVVFELEVVMQHAGKSFPVREGGFLIRTDAGLRAYRNHCPHVGSPLDWVPGRFFDDDGTTLLCHTHGARFDAETGDCLAGPCPRGLYALPCREVEGGVEVPAYFEGA